MDKIKQAVLEERLNELIEKVDRIEVKLDQQIQLTSSYPIVRNAIIGFFCLIGAAFITALTTLIWGIDRSK